MGSHARIVNPVTEVQPSKRQTFRHASLVSLVKELRPSPRRSILQANQITVHKLQNKVPLKMLMPVASVPSSLPGAPTITTSLVPTRRTEDTTWTKLFVGGLPYHTTDKTLREHFEVYGDIEEAVVITDRNTGKSKGYGFVIMTTKEEAERACKETNPIIEGRKANVNLAIIGAKPRGNVTARIPYTTLPPGFQTDFLPGQYGALTLAGQLGLTAATPQVTSATLGLAPGKALSSRNLHVMSGRAPVPQNNPTTAYLQQLYAASSLYGIPTPGGFLPLGGMATTGSPVLDMFGQYASQLQ